MAQRPEKRRRTIDPTRVETIEDWLNFYGQRYTNLRLDDGGYYSVYDPVDSKKLVKRITLKKGVDAAQILASSDTSKLRVDAITTYDELQARKNTAIATVSAEYVEKEAELLVQTRLWEQSHDTAQRATLARQIGVLTRELERLDTKLQNARYSRRTIRSDETMTGQMIDYRSHDTSKLGYTLHYCVPEYTTVAERIVSLPTEAEKA